MSAEKSPETQKDIDRLNRDIAEAHIVTMLEHYRRVNEGANAIIGLVNFSELDERLIKYFFDDKGKEKPENEKLAIKMLKVYADPQMAHEEGERQIKAREILLANPIEGVSIPEIYFCDTVPVFSQTLKEHLEAEGIDVDKGGIGVVLMDFVDGEDMMAYIYKEIIKKFQEVNPEQNEKQLEFNPGFKEVDKHLEHGDEINFLKLEERASLAIDLKVASTTKAKQEVRDENTKKIIKFLADTGFVLDPSIIERLQKVTATLHKNGFFHRDLHERNIMFSFAEDGSIETLSLIDFEKSAVTEPGNFDVYHEDSGPYPDDNYVATEFSAITKPKDVKEHDEFFSRITRQMQAIQDNEKYKEALGKMQTKITRKVESSKDEEELIDEIRDGVNEFADLCIKDSDSEDNFNLRLSLWNEIITKHHALSNLIKQELTKQLQNSRALNIYKNNTLKKFIEYIK